MERKGVFCKQAVFMRHGNKCDKCGITGNNINNDDEQLTIHHIKKVENGGSNRYQNLAVLCRKCHRSWHFLQDYLELDDHDYHKWVKNGRCGKLLDHFYVKIREIRDLCEKRKEKRVQNIKSWAYSHVRRIKIRNFTLEWKNSILESRLNNDY